MLLSVSCIVLLIAFWSAATFNNSNCCIVLRYPTLESVWRTCLRDIRILHTSLTKTLVHSCCRMSSGTGRSWSEQTVICEWRSKQMNHRSSKYCNRKIISAFLQLERQTSRDNCICLILRNISNISIYNACVTMQSTT